MMHPFQAEKTFVPIIFFLFMAVLLIPQPLLAESTNGCHCFKNRVYDPNNKFAADGYVLASTFNSLISRSFDLSKRQIVMLKMQGGVGQDDLLIGLETAKITGIELQQLLELRQKQDSWKKILSNPPMPEQIKKSAVLTSLKSSMGVNDAAEKIADNLIGTFYNIPKDSLEGFRSSGLNEKEMALLFTLSRTKGVKAQNLAEQYQKEGKSWSEIAHELGMNAAAPGKLLMNYQ